MGRKRKSGEGTVRLRKDGRWEGRVVIGYDEKNLPRTKSVLAKTKTECVEKLAALKAIVESPSPNRAKPDMPFETWLDFWYENYSRPNLRPNTQRCYEAYLRRYIKPQLGHVPLNKLTAADIQQFCVRMKTDGRINKRDGHSNGISNSQIRGCLNLCRRALDKAVEERLLTQNPAKDCKTPLVQRQEMRVLSREEMQRVLIQAKEEGCYEVFLLEFATGLRLGELTALQWDDLNMDTGELCISKQVCRVKGKLAISQPKTGNSIRTLILPPKVVTVLKEYKAKTDSRWLFPSPQKEDCPIAPEIISHRFQKLLKHSGCRQVRFHDLRHTFATNALEYGMDIKTLSAILGHASSATTLNVYAHITDEMRRSAADKIDRGITKRKAS